MRFALILAAAAVLSAPAVAQQLVPLPTAPAPSDAPPPEGFYNDIRGAYDLLLRPSAFNDLTTIRGQRLLPHCDGPLSDGEKRTSRYAPDVLAGASQWSSLALKELDGYLIRRMINGEPKTCFLPSAKASSGGH